MVSTGGEHLRHAQPSGGVNAVCDTYTEQQVSMRALTTVQAHRYRFATQGLRPEAAIIKATTVETQRDALNG